LNKLLPLLAFSVLLLLPLVQLTHATHVTPVFTEGNPKCPSGLASFKIENVPDFDEVFTQGVFSVTITLSNSPDVSPFDWLSNFDVLQVIAKGGPNANIYNYNPAETEDTGLVIPTNPNSNQPYGMSHIDFCFNPPVSGEIIPIETTSLILAGAQSFSWMIPVMLSVLGIGLFVVSRNSLKLT